VLQLKEIKWKKKKENGNTNFVLDQLDDENTQTYIFLRSGI